MSPTDPLPEALRAPKPASAATLASHERLRRYLPFDDRTDFDAAARGFIATRQPLTIAHARAARPAYDLSGLDFLHGESPASVNPSLWRQAQLNANHTGLYEVCEGIWQVRGFDLANMTLVRGERGWIIIDPLTAAETASAALALANEQLGERPVTAVIYTHSHVDHFAGVLGVIDASQAASGEVAVLAPPAFTEEALAENVLAGNVMNRRATYMYGNLLPQSPEGFVTDGLGANLALGSTGFVPPNDTIETSGERRVLDGVEIEFLLTMGTEAPSEMVFYFPAQRALCMSEITSHHLHNVYTPRGAQVRDALAWAEQIDDALSRFGERLELQFASHHWPIWGRDAVADYLEKQRDLYKFIHDQTLRLANHGYTPEEIAARLRLPDSLGREFYNRDYYGTVNHNCRAVYVRYLGAFDGNPTRLNPLPPGPAARRYVEYMGGVEAVLEKARASFAEHDYQWVCQVLQHVVDVDPEQVAARALLADALEQLGYQAESGPWRNFYLCGAWELRHGVPTGSRQQIPAGMAAGMPLRDFFKAIAVRIDPAAADGLTLRINLAFSDAGPWALQLDRSVLHAWPERRLSTPDLTLSLTSADFKTLLLEGAADATLGDWQTQERLTADGDLGALTRLGALLDSFQRRFPIMTPRPD